MSNQSGLNISKTVLCPSVTVGERVCEIAQTQVVHQVSHLLHSTYRNTMMTIVLYCLSLVEKVGEYLCPYCKEMLGSFLFDMNVK